MGFGQSYDLAFGIRLGTEIGLTGQVRLPMIHKNFAGEVILQNNLRRDEFMVTALGKQHYPLITRRVNIFLGGGVHKGWLTGEENGTTYDAPFGLTAIGGAEVTLGRLNLSYDFKPAINISGGAQTIYTQSGISARYVLSKRNDIFDKKAEKERNKRRKQRERDKRREERRRNGDSEWWKIWKKDGG